MRVLRKPKSEKQLKKMVGERVTFIMAVSLEDLLDHDIESLNELSDETFIGDNSFTLLDINYKPVEVRKDGCILIKVDADLEEF